MSASAQLCDVSKAVHAAGAPVLAESVFPPDYECTTDDLQSLRSLGVVSIEAERGADGSVAVAFARTEELKKRLSAADSALEALSAKERELERKVREAMDALHAYNEAKDATQALLGKLAEWDGTTVREQHEIYGLPTEEDDHAADR